MNGLLGCGETRMNVSLSSESDRLYLNDVLVLCVGFVAGGLQSENACGEGKSSGSLSSLVILSDVDALKGDRNLPLNDRQTKISRRSWTNNDPHVMSVVENQPCPDADCLEQQPSPHG